MSVIQHVREVQGSSDLPPFDCRSINIEAGTVSTGHRAPQIKISILMRVYNEHGTIGRAVCEVLAADCPCEVELFRVRFKKKNELTLSTASQTELKGLFLAPLPTHPEGAEQPDFVGPGARL
jgi:hypothetical protein